MGVNARRLGLSLAVTLAVWMAVSATAFADLRIRAVDVFWGEEAVTDLYLTRSAIRIAPAAGISEILLCATDEMILLSPADGGVYWRGSRTELAETFAAWFAEMFQSMPPELVEFMGGSAPASVDVRITRQGEDVIAGYDAVHYLIEYDDGTGWREAENVWISERLMREIEAEAGDCVMRFMELQWSLENTLTALGTDAVLAAATHSDYRALLAQGFPMRNVVDVDMFDVPVTMETMVQEVSKESIPADVFAVPDHYRRVDDPIELLQL